MPVAPQPVRAPFRDTRSAAAPALDIAERSSVFRFDPDEHDGRDSWTTAPLPGGVVMYDEDEDDEDVAYFDGEDEDDDLDEEYDLLDDEDLYDEDEEDDEDDLFDEDEDEDDEDEAL